MGEFQLGSTSLDVCKIIIQNNPIEEVKIISHEVGLNWSQKYTTKEDRKNHFMEAYHHKKDPTNVYSLSREEFLNTDLEEFSRELNENEVLSFVSKVKTYEKTDLHVPMMNFHPENDFGLDEIKKSLRHIIKDKKGILLDSGRYYHYYGDYLLNQREWETFLGNFLIPFSLVHPGYIGYRLTCGYSTLRLTSNAKHKPQTPKVIGIL